MLWKGTGNPVNYLREQVGFCHIMRFL